MRIQLLVSLIWHWSKYYHLFLDSRDVTEYFNSQTLLDQKALYLVDSFQDSFIRVQDFFYYLWFIIDNY